MLTALHLVPSANNIKNALFTRSWLACLFWVTLSVLAPVKFFVFKECVEIRKIKKWLVCYTAQVALGGIS